MKARELALKAKEFDLQHQKNFFEKDENEIESIR